MKININSPFFQFINTLYEFILLNLIFLITCLPIITIGPAITALYKVTMQETRGEHGYMIRAYLKGIKENLGTGIAAFLFIFIAGSILFFNMSFWASYGGLLGMVLLFIVTLAFLVLLLSALYVFPLLARFQNSLKQTLQNALSMSFIHKKTTLLLLLVHSAAVLIFIFVPFIRILIMIMGFSFLALCCSYPLTKILKEYEP